MQRERAYAVLCGAWGALTLVAGAALFLAFFAFHAPGSRTFGPVRVGPWGAYFMAFAGCALVAWGGALLGVARRPDLGRSVGTATALACSLAALQRMVAWVVGDYHAVGDLPRVEAALLLAVALAFVWLRPPHAVAAPGPLPTAARP